MIKISWTKEAESDFFSIFDNLEKISPVSADRFYYLVKNKEKQIQSFPKSGRIVPEIDNSRIREVLVGKYRMFYLIKSDDLVEILAIIYQGRKIT